MIFRKKTYRTYYVHACLMIIAKLTYFQAMAVFIKTCGFKNTAKLIWQYPAMILTPIFSFWTIGPKKTRSTTKSGCGCYTSNDMRIGVSFFYTFINIFITIIGNYLFRLITTQKLMGDVIVISIFYIFALVYTSMLTCIKKSKGKSILCGVPLLKMQYFDINEWDVIKEGENPKHDQDFKMSEYFQENT